MLPSTVYLLCCVASIGCAALLVRSYLRTRTRLLMWSAACFLLLAANNSLVVIDLVLLPTSVDLLPLRRLFALSAVGVLLVGFIWETD